MSDRQQIIHRLHRFPVVNTADRDEFHDLLVDRYDARDLEIGTDVELRARINCFRFKQLDLNYSSQSAPVAIKFAGNELVRQQFILSGSSRITAAPFEFDVGVNKSAIVPAEADVRYDFGADSSHLFIRISAKALRSKLTALMGRPVARTLEFKSGVSVQSAEQLRFQRLIEFVLSELDAEGPGVSEIQLAHLEQLLIVSFLNAHEHNFSQILQREPTSPATWQVHLVEDYIEANWDKHITIEELAAACSVGVRNIFAKFKKARGYTPMKFLQQTRLHHARRMLQRPSDTTTVATVAFECGFANAGHFARHYQQAFGELPSVTLAVGRAAF